jgi:hypothetical protein
MPTTSVSEIEYALLSANVYGNYPSLQPDIAANWQ